MAVIVAFEMTKIFKMPGPPVQLGYNFVNNYVKIYNKTLRILHMYLWSLVAFNILFSVYSFRCHCCCITRIWAFLSETELYCHICIHHFFQAHSSVHGINGTRLTSSTWRPTSAFDA